MIAIWTAAEIALGHSGPPAEGTLLLDDHGSLRSDYYDDAARLDCVTAIVQSELCMRPCLQASPEPHRFES